MSDVLLLMPLFHELRLVTNGVNEDASRHSISTSPFDTNGPLRPSEYTTTTDFLLESRLQVWWRNKAAISGVYSCLASGVLGCRLYGS